MSLRYKKKWTAAAGAHLFSCRSSEIERIDNSFQGCACAHRHTHTLHISAGCVCLHTLGVHMFMFANTPVPVVFVEDKTGEEMSRHPGVCFVLQS